MLMKQTKGKSSAILSTLQKICGNKKSNQDQVSMKDPNSNLEVFEPNEIKTISLQYCVDLLTQRTVY